MNIPINHSPNDTMGKLRNMTSIYLTCENKILLLHRHGSKVVDNLWVGSAGGHFEPDELNDAKACVMRELKEELGLTEDLLSNLTMRYVTMRRTDCEIRQNYYFFAELKEAERINLVSSEGNLKWFSFDEIDFDSVKMPFTARYMLEHWLKVGRFTDKMYGGITTDKNVAFTEMPIF